ncbi:MAG TPA: hypothetical protein VNS58_13710 [Puia sp.]|nr:hypothetical protein [Puia sp.]
MNEALILGRFLIFYKFWLITRLKEQAEPSDNLLYCLNPLIKKNTLKKRKKEAKRWEKPVRARFPAAVDAAKISNEFVLAA